jgi:small GTP-binding protein
MKER